MGQEVEEIRNIIENDEAMYELEERLKKDQEFAKTFHRKIEEIKQIRIPNV